MGKLHLICKRMLRTGGLNEPVRLQMGSAYFRDRSFSNDENYEGMCYFKEDIEPFLQEAFSHL